ncbi:hypothetical protein [Streptomyces chilikensis]|uniref:Uncharacterized protein n=1 Tax=Streptomyces chilikensis TaxID=1194079 RepID=A0ABV3EHX3_9ACTN
MYVTSLAVYVTSPTEPLTVLPRRHGVRPLLVTWGTPCEGVERHNLRAAVAPAGISPAGRGRVAATARRPVPEPHRRRPGAKPDGGEALAATTGSLLPPLIDGAAKRTV